MTHGTIAAGEPASEPHSPVDGVRDEHDVLVPRHELPLARSAADDEPLHAAFDLQAAEVGASDESADRSPHNIARHTSHTLQCSRARFTAVTSMNLSR